AFGLVDNLVVFRCPGHKFGFGLIQFPAAHKRVLGEEHCHSNKTHDYNQYDCSCFHASSSDFSLGRTLRDKLPDTVNTGLPLAFCKEGQNWADREMLLILATCITSRAISEGVKSIN